jgi:hypothetical protein
MKGPRLSVTPAKMTNDANPLGEMLRCVPRVSTLDAILDFPGVHWVALISVRKGERWRGAALGDVM